MTGTATPKASGPVAVVGLGHRGRRGERVEGCELDGPQRLHPADSIASHACGVMDGTHGVVKHLMRRGWAGFR